MSLIWMPAQTTVPPFTTARSAAGTSAPTGAKMIAASSGSGGEASLAPGPAKTACPAAPPQPWHSHPLVRRESLDARAGRYHGADDLVAQHERQLRVRELAVGDMEIGAAHAARLHGEQDLARTGLGAREVSGAEGLARGVDEHGTHVRISDADCGG